MRQRVREKATTAYVITGASLQSVRVSNRFLVSAGSPRSSLPARCSTTSISLKASSEPYLMQKKSGKRARLGAAYSARYNVEVALGLRQSDFSDAIEPLKSVQAW